METEQKQNHGEGPKNEAPRKRLRRVWKATERSTTMPEVEPQPAGETEPAPAAGVQAAEHAAAPDGMDSAVAAPPREAPDSKSDEEQPGPERPRKRVPVWLRVFVGVAVVLAALLVLAAAYLNGKLDMIHYHDGTVEQVGEIEATEDQDLDGTGLVENEEEMVMPEGSPFADDDVLNILLISTDERTEAVNDWDAFTHLNELDGTRKTTEFSENARADSLILVSLNIQQHTIKLTSIERGTGVPILLDGWDDQYDWITHTFRYGGAKLTMDTVEDCFNVQVDHYVRINFNSFVQIVDAVGGVDIELTELEAKALNWEVPSNSMLIIGKVEPGWNHLDGYTALQYARLRTIDNDWTRIKRQRTVIQAVLDAVRSASVTELDALLNAVLPLVQTNFTKTEIAALLVQLPGFLGVQTQQLSVPVDGTYGVRYGMNDRLMYDPDWAVNIAVLQEFLYTDHDIADILAATPETAARLHEAEQTDWQEETGPEAPELVDETRRDAAQQEARNWQYPYTPEQKTDNAA